MGIYLFTKPGVSWADYDDDDDAPYIVEANSVEEALDKVAAEMPFDKSIKRLKTAKLSDFRTIEIDN